MGQVTVQTQTHQQVWTFLEWQKPERNQAHVSV